MYKIAIFASGSGSNALKIIQHFAQSEIAETSLVISNRIAAGVFEHADNNEVPKKYIPGSVWKTDPNQVLDILKAEQIDFIALAGFLLKVPEVIITEYGHKMLNIHPALLPKYGGKGMYGMHVHEAVKANNESESGITIHYVNNVYDDGAHVFQAKTELSDTDSASDIQKKVLALEHKWFPTVIEQEIKKLDA